MSIPLKPNLDQRDFSGKDNLKIIQTGHCSARNSDNYSGCQPGHYPG